MMDTKRVLFVCLGNICRSPSAEAVFNGILKNTAMRKHFEVDSAGTSGWHNGQPADRRMQKHSLNRGLNLTSISRAFNPSTDFDYFDYIIGMDDQNMSDLRNMARNEIDIDKLYKMTDFCSTAFKYSEVPDPYYGGEEGFELVLDLLEDSCAGLLESIKNCKI